MVQNFPQTSLQTAKTSLQTAKTSLQTSKTRLFFLFSFLQQNTYLPAYSVMGVHSLVPLTPSSLGHT